MLSHKLQGQRLKLGALYKGHYGTAETGTIAALLAAGGVIWTFRNPENSGKILGASYIRPLTMNVVAFTTAVTPGRGLDLVKLIPDAPGTANPSGGNAWTVKPLSTGYPTPVGVGRVATTGALTTTGFTATGVFRKHWFANSGAAAGTTVNTWSFGQNEEPIILLPGECLALQASQAMDAAGTFLLVTDYSGFELG